MEATRYHSLLADLHRLLGGYTSEEFLEASQRSNDCQDLLRSLSGISALEKSPGPSPGVQEIVASNEYIAPAPYLKASFTTTPEEIENLLRRSGKAETNGDMVAISHAFDLGLVLSSKDARARNLTKLAKAIAFSAPKLRNHIVKELNKKGNSETQGWLDVIRSRA